jgi:hypothetical protein
MTLPRPAAHALDPEREARQHLRPEDVSEELLEPNRLGCPCLPSRPLTFVFHLGSGVLERTLSNRLADKVGGAGL